MTAIALKNTRSSEWSASAKTAMVHLLLTSICIVFFYQKASVSSHNQTFVNSVYIKVSASPTVCTPSSDMSKICTLVLLVITILTIARGTLGQVATTLCDSSKPSMRTDSGVDSRCPEAFFGCYTWVTISKCLALLEYLYIHVYASIKF